MASLKWLEALHAVIKDQLMSKEDCLVAVLHCIMVNKGNKCVGLGDSWDQSSDSSTELLPEGWNSSQAIYTLRYSSIPNSKYLMKIVKTNSSLLVNLLDVNKSKAAGMSVTTDEFINDDFKSFVGAYKNLRKIESDFDDSVSKAIKLGDAPSNSSKSDRNSSESSNVPDDPLIEERFSYPYTTTEPQPRGGLPSVGRTDLDPLGGFSGGIGGGMLFDPSGMGRQPQRPDFGIGGPPGMLPRAAVPPGARFDPFGPPSGGPRPPFPPDSDLMPPGFGDSFI